MWILVQKNEFFCEKCPENCHLKAGRVYKPVFIKIWSISSQKVYLGQTRPPVRRCLNRRFKKSILGFWFSLLLSPPYIIFASWLRRTPDIQAETGQPIYFWNPLLKAVVLQKTDFFFWFYPSCSQNEANNAQGFLVH